MANRSTGHEVIESSRKSTVPSRGKRYSPAQKKEIFAYAEANDVKSAAEKFGPRETTIYEWRRVIKRRGKNDVSMDRDTPEATLEEDPKEIRDQRILAMWRRHPGYGPSQIRNILKRDGFKVSVGTTRHVMEENGYLATSLKDKATFFL